MRELQNFMFEHSKAIHGYMKSQFEKGHESKTSQSHPLATNSPSLPSAELKNCVEEDYESTDAESDDFENVNDDKSKERSQKKQRTDDNPIDDEEMDSGADRVGVTTRSRTSAGVGRKDSSSETAGTETVGRKSTGVTNMEPV